MVLQCMNKQYGKTNAEGNHYGATVREQAVTPRATTAVLQCVNKHNRKTNAKGNHYGATVHEQTR